MTKKCAAGPVSQRRYVTIATSHSSKQYKIIFCIRLVSNEDLPVLYSFNEAGYFGERDD